MARVCSYLARTEPTLAPEFLKAALPMLVNGTKEKNGYVKANSELSLVAVLKLRQGDAVVEVALTITWTLSFLALSLSFSFHESNYLISS